MTMTARDFETLLSLWAETEGGNAQLINHSENQTFLIESPGRERFVLRLHRVGYQSRPSIESELAWLGALEGDTSLPLPRPVHGRDGNVLQGIETEQGPRLAVLFHHIEGTEPHPDEALEPLFETLGAYAATLHHHVTAWQPPVGFERQVWKAATILDVDGLWGDWRSAPGVTPRVRTTLDKLEQVLWSRLAEYGTEPDRYGLIHADMRLGNLLVDRDRVTLIDFDDCGFCWFAYDFAAAISFHETHASIPGLRAAWLRGYQPLRPLSAADIAAIDSMVMLRRMALLAWIGSHAETSLAQEHMPGFAEGTVDLAERYLRGALWS
jgi:Ser/Thr protein kinase RdoA (MazF antagonist)